MYENEIYSGSDAGRYSAYQTGGSPNGGHHNNNDGNQKKGGFRKVVLSAGLGLCFGLFAGGAFYAVKLGADQWAATGNQNSNVTGEVLNPAALPSTALTNINQITYVRDDITDVVEEVMPAMVTIENSYTTISYSIWGQAYSRTAVSSGTGIIVGENDNELLIVSNNHVVEDADSLKITFIDGSTAEAIIKGLDPDMDLAVVAVSLENLTSETRDAITIATLGDSDNLKLGTPVIAIGNALGYGQSVTTGVVSALNRQVTMEDGSVGTFIQTDAAINHGNSGGALLNLNGEVIGINSSKIEGSAVEGMGYAIPISAASPIVAELMERQTRTKVAEGEMGYMGIGRQDVTSQISQAFGIPQGVYVIQLEEGSPADQGGLRVGDIIVKFDGTKVTTDAELINMMQYYRSGDTVTVTVRRFENGRYDTLDLEITLGTRPQ